MNIPLFFQLPRTYLSPLHSGISPRAFVSAFLRPAGITIFSHGICQITEQNTATRVQVVIVHWPIIFLIDRRSLRGNSVMQPLN